MFRFLRIHTVPDEGGGSTWLQLFFDLVYVAILIQLGSRLSHDLTLEGAIEFAFLFIPIWWSWLEFVLYGRYFPVDDIGQRILTVLYMAFMLAMAFEIHDVTGATAASFVFAYGLSKLVLALMYARAWAQFPEYRTTAGHYTIAFVLVGLLWITIALIAPTNFWLWGIVMLVGILIPPIVRLIRDKSGRTELSHPPTKYQFMLHRFGELTIIVLGEFFIKLVMFTMALTIALLAYAVIEWAIKENEEPLTRRAQPWLRIGGAAVLLILGMGGGSLNVDVLVLFIVAVLLLQVGFDVYKRLQRPDHERVESSIPA